MTELELKLLTTAYREASIKKKGLLQVAVRDRWDGDFYKRVLEREFPDPDIYELGIRDFIAAIESGNSEFYSSIVITGFGKRAQEQFEENLAKEKPQSLLALDSLWDTRLVATSYDVVIQGINFNKFTVSTKINRYLNHGTSNEISPVHPVVSLQPIDSHNPHPHMSGSRLCYGEGLDSLCGNVLSGNFIAAMNTLGGILYTYNGGSPYRRLDAYRTTNRNGVTIRRLTCTDCNTLCDISSSSIYCDGCRKFFCNDCAIKICSNCSRRVCSECILKDPHDDSLFCQRCKYYGETMRCMYNNYSLYYRNRENRNAFELDDFIKKKNILRKKVKSIPGYLDRLNRRINWSRPIYVPNYSEYQALSNYIV